MRKIATKLPPRAAPPVLLVAPTISGTAQVGKTLSAMPGGYTNRPRNYAYQWQNEGSNIAGATGSSYTLQTKDIGALITVMVTPSNGAGAGAPARSGLYGPVIGTTVRYVSNSVGNDAWDGTAPAFVSGTTGPWKTIAKVNAQTFAPGTSVLFKRGDTWREQLSPTSSGTSGNPIVFDAYGTGDAPLILGSVSAANTSDWTLISGNIWKSAASFPPVSLQAVTFSGSPGNVVVTWSGTPAPAAPKDGRGVAFYTTGTLPAGLVLGQGYFIRNASGKTCNLSTTPTGALVAISSAGSGTHSAGINGFPSNKANDIGNLIFTSGGVTQTGTTTYTIWTGQKDSNLTSQGQWYFSIADWKVHVYSTTNPASAMPGLELAIDRSSIYPKNKTFHTYQNLAIKYAAGSGIIILQSTNVTVRDMHITCIGGGNLNGDNVRFGNGIDVELSGSNHLIERNLVEQCYDSGITLQPLTSGSPQSNIIFRNNIIKNGTQGTIQIITFGASLNNISVYSNTCYNAIGWSEGQRWGSGGSSEDNQRFGLYHSDSGGPSPTNYKRKNNAYTGLGTSCSIRHPSSPVNAWGGAGKMQLDYNLWSRENGSAPTTCLVSPSAGNPTLASWAAGYSLPHEVNGKIGVDPAFTNAAAGDFTPLSGSPLKNSGTNLFSAGVVWDFNKNPRPTSGMFTIGAIQ
ncbi:MAG: right-handed parallel beta-helix repeat-containing protein [Beijerinckiaceae bacterium]